jgi:ATP-dependent helicase IRC3
MIEEGWLCDVMFTTVRIQKGDLSKVKTGPSGDFVPSALAGVINQPENNEAVVKVWKEKCAHDRKSTLIFCVTVEHMHDVAAAFASHGIDVRSVQASTRAIQRSATIDAFRNREFPVLLNCAVFTEGTDIANIDCVILARPTKSRNLLVQMIGRGMRLNPGKKNCHIIDMVSTLKTGIVSTPTLFGLDPDEIISEASVKDLESVKEKRDEKKKMEAGTVGNTGAPKLVYKEFKSVLDLVQDVKEDCHVRQMSPNAWIHSGTGVYLLQGLSGAFLKVFEVDDGKWQVRFVPTGKRKGKGKGKGEDGKASKVVYYQARTIVERSASLEDAIHAADTWVSLSGKSNTAFPHTIVGQRAPWRMKEATEAQVAFLKKRGIVLSEQGYTCGHAGDMIGKLMLGAKGKYLEMQKIEAREEKEHRKWKKMKARETVQVGSLNLSSSSRDDSV